ncbi:MAG: HAD hydrolase-like protein [Gammaproteobacteria bacterium]|nr:HAD hydrolase-like protein [Gammaproteobacteria bacterium]
MRTVFFDLDGTLTDPSTGITRCIQYALKELEQTPPMADDLTWCIGPPLLQSLEKLVPPGQAPQALRLYRERFGDVGWRENRVYPDVPKLLEELRAAGIVMHLATSKPHVYATRIVRHFGLRPFITQVFGSELDGTRTDKSELLHHALESVATSGAVIMVGDRHHDILGARANSLEAIGVSYGFGSRDELTGAGARYVVDSPAELAPLLMKFP